MRKASERIPFSAYIRRCLIPLLILAPLLLGGCDSCGKGGKVKTNPLPGFSGPYKVSVTGTVKAGAAGAYDLEGGTADIKFADGEVTWTGTHGGIGTPDPGNRNGTGTITVSPDDHAPPSPKKHKFHAVITLDQKDAHGNAFVLTLDGYVDDGPPQSGLGTWSIDSGTSPNTTNWGAGNWNFTQ